MWEVRMLHQPRVLPGNPRKDWWRTVVTTDEEHVARDMYAEVKRMTRRTIVQLLKDGALIDGPRGDIQNGEFRTW